MRTGKARMVLMFGLALVFPIIGVKAGTDVQGGAKLFTNTYSVGDETLGIAAFDVVGSPCVATDAIALAEVELVHSKGSVGQRVSVLLVAQDGSVALRDSQKVTAFLGNLSKEFLEQVRQTIHDQFLATRLGRYGFQLGVLQTPGWQIGLPAVSEICGSSSSSCNCRCNSQGCTGQDMMASGNCLSCLSSAF